MARKHLIHYHTSTTNLPSADATEGIKLGEIAVQHNTEAPELIIATVTGNTSEARFAHFIDSSAVQVKINNTVNPVNQAVNDLKGIVGTGFTGKTLTDAIEDLQEGTLASVSGGDTNFIQVGASEKDASLNQVITATAITKTLAETSEANDGLAIAYDVKQGIKAVDDKIGGNYSSASTVADAIGNIVTDVTTLKGLTSGYTGDGSIKTAVDSAQTTANSALTLAQTALQGVSGTTGNYVTVNASVKDSANTQTISAALTIQAVSSASASAKGVAEASDVKTYVDTQVGGVSTDVNTIKSQLAGFNTTSGAVKTYVDDKVADAITSVYRVKGTKATAEELPTSGQVTGDVWNIASASTYGPAGTNVVWTGSGWDALGGTVDLTPYQTVSGFTAYTAEVATAMTEIRNNVTSLSSTTGTLEGILSGYTTVGSVSADVQTAKTAAAGALTGVSITGDNFVGFTAGTVANQNLPFTAAVKTHAIDNAEAEADGLATAFAVKTVTDTIAENVRTISGTTTANTEAIDALEEIVGTGFTQTTLTDKIASLVANSYEGLATGTSQYITISISGIDGTTHKETISASAVTVAIDDAVADSNDGLVLASNAKAKFTTIGQSITDINTKLGGDFSSSKTVASEITRLDNAMLTNITPGAADEYVTLTIGAKSNKAQSITVDTKVVPISSATTATDGLAVASDVKAYVDDVNNAVAQNTSDIATINSKLGGGFTSDSTVTSQLADVKTTADGAVQSISVKNSTTNLITATEDSTTHNVEFNFDSMVIDCGEY